MILVDENLYNATVLNSNVNVVLNEKFLTEMMNLPQLPPVSDKEKLVAEYYEKTSLNQMLIVRFGSFNKTFFLIKKNTFKDKLWK